MGPTHPPPPLKERAFGWDLQMEHLPAVLMLLGLQALTCVWSLPEAPLFHSSSGKGGEQPGVVLLGPLERKCCLSREINNTAGQSAQPHSSQKKMLSSSPVDASSLLAHCSCSFPQPCCPCCNPGFCSSSLPLLPFGDCVIIFTKAIRDVAHANNTKPCFAALWFHRFLFLSLLGL